ncbi:MAG: hypothetical protein WCH75_00195 [Candidatus Binatia bacterium]
MLDEDRIKIVMLTGHNRTTAEAVAKKLDIFALRIDRCYFVIGAKYLICVSDSARWD